MKPGKGAWLALAALVAAGCSGRKGPFREIRSWEFKDLQTAMVFCAAAQDQDEAAVRREAERIAQDRLPDWRQVYVVILYDAAHAKAVSSGRAMKDVMQGGGGDANAYLYGGKIEGGGFLAMAAGDLAPRWTFVPWRDTEAPAQDRGFSQQQVQ